MQSLLSSPSKTAAQAARTAPSGRPSPGAFASFARFVLCGGGIGVLSSAVVPLVAQAMPWVVANALITVVSTLLCTELHARFTFGTGRRAGWRQHWQSAGSATAAYAVTSAAVLILHAIQASPTLLTEQLVYLGASALTGAGRFLILRLLVFTPNHDHPPKPTLTPTPTSTLRSTLTSTPTPPLSLPLALTPTPLRSLVATI
ncbi:GtrA family protein [Streptomyces sp. NPDC087425]|uniref:GtrA family protein n=1 Tax=Streptomyces sp. NPDC087425 TaxID=3365787 RepID=UPI00380287AF